MLVKSAAEAGERLPLDRLQPLRVGIERQRRAEREGDHAGARPLRAGRRAVGVKRAGSVLGRQEAPTISGSQVGTKNSP